EPGGGGGGGGGQPQPKGGIKAQDGIPAVAQLKALKAEQLEINARTKEFAERHPDMNQLTADEQKELATIHAEQDRLRLLFVEMQSAATPEGGEKQWTAATCYV